MDDGRHLLELLRKAEGLAKTREASANLDQDTLEVRVVSPGETIYEQGAPGDWMFIVDTGEITVLQRTESGAQVEVAALRPGDYGGMLSLFEKEPRSATLVARGEATLLILRHDVFRRLIRNNDELAMGMFAFMSRRMRRDAETLAKLKTAGHDPRFAVAIYDSKPYSRDAFTAENKNRFALHFFEHRLSLATVASAVGFNAICVFVHDTIDAPVVERLSDFGVGLVALRCAGFNNVDLEACRKHGIDVVHVPAYSPQSVAEHAVALILDLNRRVHRAYGRVREGNFSLDGLVGFEMFRKVVGVIGTGRIGKRAAKILLGFGCEILAYDKFQDPELAQTPNVTYVDLEAVLRQSDIITLHIPLFPETRHMINAEAIAKMKRGVMLINTSRGALVDTKALIHGLKTGKVGSAGLDVYEEESQYFFEDFSDTVITDDVLARLLTFNNVVVTSHQAFLTKEALTNIAQTTFDNIAEYRDGKRGKNLTNATLSK